MGPRRPPRTTRGDNGSRDNFLSSFSRLLASNEPLLAPSAYRRKLRLFLGYIAVVTAIYGLLTLRFYRSWTVADWLINYEGGFVRRGLPGQIAWDLGRVCHLSPVFFVGLALSFAYAMLFASVARLAWDARPSWWCLALLISPATLSFQILDVTGGFRKEILYLAMLAAVLAAGDLGSARPAETATRQIGIALAGSLTVAALVLSHESLICFTPYLVAALCVCGMRFRDAMKVSALPLLTGLVLAFVSLRHLGDLRTAQAICASLGYPLVSQGKAVCAGGAMGYLGYTPAMARARTWTVVRDDLYFLVYPLATALAMLPLIGGGLGLSRQGWGREVRIVWKAAALSLCLSLPLFVYAEDWGRWLYIHLLSLALLLLTMTRGPRQQGKALVPEAPSEGSSRRGWWALLAYATLWSLPHVPSRTLPFGYLGLLHYLRLYL